MKKTATIFLLILVASIQTPLGQILKLPLLIEHYVKHQRQEGISLIGFLEVHYVSDHNDADLPEDEQLPFKNSTFSSVDYAVVTPVAAAAAPGILFDGKKEIFREAYSPQQHLANIFQPPRV